MHYTYTFDMEYNFDRNGDFEDNQNNVNVVYITLIQHKKDYT